MPLTLAALLVHVKALADKILDIRVATVITMHFFFQLLCYLQTLSTKKNFDMPLFNSSLRY